MRRWQYQQWAKPGKVPPPNIDKWAGVTPQIARWGRTIAFTAAIAAGACFFCEVIGWQGTIRVGSADIVNPAAVRLGTQELTAAQIDKIVIGEGEI